MRNTHAYYNASYSCDVAISMERCEVGFPCPCSFCNFDFLLCECPMMPEQCFVRVRNAQLGALICNDKK